MAGVKDMLDQARKSLGWGEPNPIHKWYGKRNGSYFAKGSTPWCNMAITYWAYHSGNYAAVCGGTDYAYTVWHAEWFQKKGQWISGTAANVKKAKPGDIVFFDWGGSNSIGAIDHVGIVEKNNGNGTVTTIEGNTSNQCLRKTRDASTIAGFGRPKYSGESGSGVVAEKPVEKGKAPSANLSINDSGEQVKGLQRALNSLGAKLVVDGDFGPATLAALKDFQRAAKLTPDGEYGPLTRAALQAALSSSSETTPKPKPKVEAPAGNPLLRKGSKGSSVTRLQKALVAAGFKLPKYGVDGDFGAETEAAVKQLQKKAKITVDGIYGPQSAKALSKLLS